MEYKESGAYPFPYYLFPERARIVLYGAGKVGSSYYEDLQKSNRIEVVQWIDKNYQKLNEKGKLIAGIDKIREMEFDYVLIAIADRNVAMEVRAELMQTGIDDKKIVWNEIICTTAMREQFFYKEIQLYKKVIEWLAEEKREHLQFFLFLTPEHGNLGDHAILLAEREFFRHYFPDIKLKEVTEWEWMNFYLLDHSKIISSEDVIFIQGGGNFGNLWRNGQWIHQIVETFPDNKIILLPNTLTYQDNDEEAMIQDAAFYRQQKNLYIFAREKKSYEKMCRLHYREDTYLNCYPDMVLWGRNPIVVGKEDTALLCMRADEEKSLDKECVDRIKNILSQREISFKETNTMLAREIFEIQREKLVEEKLMEFSKAALVVTDRLHGMIFAAIMGVPCVAFNNSTGKVEGVYQWLKELPYIRFVKDVNEFEACLDDPAVSRKYEYNTDIMRKELGKMAKQIREILK